MYKRSKFFTRKSENNVEIFILDSLEQHGSSETFKVLWLLTKRDADTYVVIASMRFLRGDGALARSTDSLTRRFLDNVGMLGREKERLEGETSARGASTPDSAALEPLC